MIKVNLLRDMTTTGRVGARTSERAFSMGTSASSSENQDFIAKIFIFVLPVIVMFAYRHYTSTLAQNEFRKLQGQVEQTQSRLKALEPEVRAVERFQEEKRKLNAQLDVIKRLSKERLKNVKSLDALQGIIPQRAWLTSLKIKETKVELDGGAVDDLVISDFMQALESSIFFMNVVLVASEEAKHDSGVVKKFSIRCNLENL